MLHNRRACLFHIFFSGVEEVLAAYVSIPPRIACPGLETVRCEKSSICIYSLFKSQPLLLSNTHVCAAFPPRCSLRCPLCRIRAIRTVTSASVYHGQEVLGLS